MARPKGHRLSPETRARIGAGVSRSAEQKRQAMRDKDMATVMDDLAALREESRELKARVKYASENAAKLLIDMQEALASMLTVETEIVAHQRAIRHDLETLTGRITYLADTFSKVIDKLAAQRSKTV